MKFDGALRRNTDLVRDKASYKQIWLLAGHQKKPECLHQSKPGGMNLLEAKEEKKLEELN